MAKAKKPAAKKSSGTAAQKPSAKSDAAKSAATVASSKASAAAKEVKATAAEPPKSVSPAQIKKETEAKSETAAAADKATVSKVEAADKVEKVAEKKPAIETTPAPAPAQPEKRGSAFWPLVFGGVIAAGLGFLVSQLDLLGSRSLTDDLRATVSSQATRLSALEAVEPPVIPEVTFPALDDLTAEVTALATRLSDIDARLTAVEKQPITGGGSEAAVAAYERELAALQASVAKQRAEIEGLLDNTLSVKQATADAAKVAKQQGALTALAGAMNSGQPFSAALETLGETGVSDVPAALSDVAADGVQTLNALQTQFPDSARASLSAARASGTNETETGFGGFLKRQLGARSVTPREGDDPDAVLSRAEAAVREGRLSDALGELDALPAPAQEAMNDWLEAARARHAAEAAAQELSQSLTAN